MRRWTNWNRQAEGQIGERMGKQVDRLAQLEKQKERQRHGQIKWMTVATYIQIEGQIGKHRHMQVNVHAR